MPRRRETQSCSSSNLAVWWGLVLPGSVLTGWLSSVSQEQPLLRTILPSAMLCLVGSADLQQRAAVPSLPCRHAYIIHIGRRSKRGLTSVAGNQHFSALSHGALWFPCTGNRTSNSSRDAVMGVFGGGLFGNGHDRPQSRTTRTPPSIPLREVWPF